MRSRWCGIYCAVILLTAAALAQSERAKATGELPDILGIRPGMPIGEAFQVLKAHDPKGSIKYGQKRIDAVSTKPITHALLYSPTASTEDPEAILVDITFPPSQQLVWRVTRTLQFSTGREVPVATLVTALRQKYGQEIANKSQSLYWVFDGRGRPLTRSSGIDLVDCAQYVEIPTGLMSYISAFSGGAPSSQNIPAGVALNPTTVAANRDNCHQFVYAAAYLSSSVARPDVATAITVAITDIGAGIRAGQATQAAMNNAASAQRQQEIKKSQQQAAPTF